MSAEAVIAQVKRTMLATERAVKSKTPLYKTIQASKTILESEARKDMGGNLSLSNWRRGKPVNVRIRDDWKNVGGDAELASMITPRPIGPMVVMTHGRNAGVSNRRKSRGRPYPGSRGKGTWTRGRTKVYQQVPTIFRREQIKLVANAFRGGRI